CRRRHPSLQPRRRNPCRRLLCPRSRTDVSISFFVFFNVRSWRNWQTHQLEGLAVAIPWWFESTRPHQNIQSIFPSFFSNALELSLKRKLVQTCEREAKKEPDPAVERQIRFTKS